MFSPYYAWARRRGRGDPYNHCALNVALYGRGARRWALTERGVGSARQCPSAATIGPSAVHWDNDRLTIEIDEVAAPIPSRIRGTVTVRPQFTTDRVFELDAAGKHRWWPIAPRSDVEVSLTKPSLEWRGLGYFDTNWGDGALEDSFVRWDWSCAKMDRGAAILYDTTCRDGDRRSLALRIAEDGRVEDFEPPPDAALPRSRWWRVERATQADRGAHPTVPRTFVDSPFYARSLVRSQLLGEPVTAMHESLSLDRFRAPWVQALIPFRMPRALR